jgi:DNA-binding NarL/FixJ family response regulator
MTIMPAKILLASGSRLFLEGVRKILDDEGIFERVIDATQYKEIVNIAKEVKPAYILIDNRMLSLDIPKLSQSIKKNSPQTKIIIMNDSKEVAREFANVIHASKYTNYQDLLQILKGHSNQEERISGADSADQFNLTNREMRILNEVTRGHSNKEISTKLSITERTVKAHLTNIFTKLGLKNRYQLMIYGKKIKNPS